MKLEVLNDRVLNLLVNISKEGKVDKAEAKRLIKELQIKPLISVQVKEKNLYQEFDNTHSAIAVYKAVDNGKNFKFVYFNSIAEKIEGIRKEKVIGKNVTEVFPGVIKFGLLDVFKKVWKTGTPSNHPVSIYEDDRILGWRENYVYKLATGEIVASYRDVTEQKRAEAEVLNSESKLKSLINNREESIWSIDTDYNYIIFNNFYKEQYFLAYKIKLEKGINSLDLLTKELYSFWKDKYDRALTGERLSFEFSIKVKKDIYFYEVWLNPIISSGKITGVSALSIDVTERILKSRALLESEEKYKQITDSSLDIIFLVDKIGKFLFFNERLEGILGYKQEEVIGKSFKKFVPIKEIPNYFNELTRVFSRKDVGHFITQIYHKNGQLVDVEITGKLIKQNGKYVGQGSIRDISERIKSEKALKESEDNYRGIFNSTSDAIYIQNKDGIFVDVNGGAEKMYGYKRDSFIGNTPEFISAPGKNDLNMVMNLVNKAYNGKEQSFEYWGLRKNGEIFPKNVTLNSGVYNGEKVVIAVAKDISEQKKYEDKIKVSEEKIKNLLQFAPDAFFQGNEVGDFIDCNEAASALTGFSKKELLQMNMKSFFTSTMLDNKPLRYDLLKSGKTLRAEREIVTKNGEIKSIEMHSKKMNEGTYQSFVRDITERKKANEELKKSEERYKHIVTNLKHAYYEANDRGVVTFVNQEFLLITGFKEDEIVGKISFLFANKDFRDKIILEYKDCRKNKKATITCEFKTKLKDGRNIWVEQFTNFQYDTKGNLLKATNIVKDITERKEAEEALVASETKYKLIAQKASDVVWLMDLKGESLFVTPSIEKFTGYSVSEYLSQTIDDRFTSQSANFAKSVLLDELTKYKSRKIRKDYSKRIELDYRCKDGLVKTGELLVTPFFGKNGSLLGIHGVTRDITERKKVENALKESERNFRLLFENSPLGTYIATPEGKIIDGNKALLEMLGSPSLEATKQINVLSFPLLVSNGYANKFKECVKTNKTLFLSIKYKSKWGSNKVYSSYVIPMSNSEGIVERVYTIMEDITDKKNAELALKDSEEKYRVISNITSDYIYESEKNSNGVFGTKWVAGSFEKITGFSLEEFKKTGDWKAHLNPLDIKKDNEALSKLKKNEDANFDVRIINKEGKIVWLNNACSPIWDKKNNKLSGIIGACSDITEKKKMVEELITSKEKAEISEKIKTEFLAQMSHEIRSPLNTIMSFIELIKEEVSDSLPDNFSYSFQSIESASTRIIRTIDLILNTTDLQLGTYKISVGEINVVNMLKQIKDEYTQSAINKGLDIQLDLEFNRKKIISDEYALIQIVSNLVDNAIKYTDKGFVKISASKGSKNGLIIKVQDSGIGMSKKFLPNLFNSFTQEEQGYTRKFDGNGLGLALVKNYCNLISTEIFVESRKGKGTIFTLEIANLKIK